MAEELEPKLLEEVVVFVRTQPDLLSRSRRPPVLLRLQRNQVRIYSGVCTDAIVRAAGMTEPGMGMKSGMDTKFGLGTEFDMHRGLVGGVGTGMGMLGLLL